MSFAIAATPLPLNKDLREFVELLNSNQVDYLIVGAFAVGFHGFPRYTGDIDILVRPTGENAAAYGMPSTNSALAGSEFEWRILSRLVQLGLPPNRIDLLTAVSVLSFEVESFVDLAHASVPEQAENPVASGKDGPGWEPLFRSAAGGGIPSSTRSGLASVSSMASNGESEDRAARVSYDIHPVHAHAEPLGNASTDYALAVRLA